MKLSNQARVSERCCLLEGDASGPLLIGNAEELSNVWGVWVGGGEEWGLGLEAWLVSDEGDFSNGAVREGEPVRGETTMVII